MLIILTIICRRRVVIHLTTTRRLVRIHLVSDPSGNSDKWHEIWTADAEWGPVIVTRFNQYRRPAMLLAIWTVIYWRLCRALSKAFKSMMNGNGGTNEAD